jgi:hypothetical protein
VRGCPASQYFDVGTLQAWHGLATHLLSALYKLYGDRRFPKFWAARSVFHNGSAETLSQYQVRYRLAGYSEWSAYVPSKQRVVVNAGRQPLRVRLRGNRCRAVINDEGRVGRGIGQLTLPSTALRQWSRSSDMPCNRHGARSVGTVRLA